MVAIETHDLTKQYGTVLSRRRRPLAVHSGRCRLRCAWPERCRQKTMMRMLTTLTKPTSGSARVMGDPITDRLALVEHIGYLPEEPPLFDELSDTSSWTISAACVISRWSQRKSALRASSTHLTSRITSTAVLLHTRRGPVRNSPSSRSCYTAPTCFSR